MSIYRALLRLYPRSFREDFEPELTRTYEESVRDRGRTAAMVAAVADVVPNAAAMHWEVLRQDIRFTVRSLRRARAFAIAAVAVIALGVGANTATFAVADFVLLRPLAFPEPDRLVRVCDGPFEGAGWGCMNQMVASRFREIATTNRTLSAVGAFARHAVNLVSTGEPTRVAAASVTPEVLPLLGVRPAAGRVFSTSAPRGDAQTVVISHSLWQRQFGGDPGTLGSQVSLNGLPYSVIGIMPPEFRFPTSDVDVWIPLLLTEADYADDGNNRLELTARLRPGMSFEQARSDLNAIARRLAGADPENFRDRGFSFFKQSDEMSPRYRVMLLALCGASLAMLLLTCSTLANLVLARAAGRERELAVRAALGAGRDRLIRQIFTEGIVLAVAGGLAGALFAIWSVPLLSRLVPNTLPMASQPVVDGRVLGIAAILSALTGLGFGLLPAIRAGRAAGFAALREGARGSGSKRRMLSGFVAVQVAVSVILLIGSGLLARAMIRVQAIDPGFDVENVLSVHTALPLPKYEDPARREEFFRRVLADVRALPGVEAAAYTSGLPFVFGGGISRVLFPGEEDKRDGSQNASYRIVTSQFFNTMGVPLLQGREFTDTDNRDRQLVAIVSESFVKRRLPDQSALGRLVEVRGETRAIVGVVGDIKVRGIERTSEPQFYLPVNQAPAGIAENYLPKDLLVRTSVAPMGLVAGVREAVRRADPQQPLTNIRPLSELLTNEFGTRRAQLRVLGALAVLALILATVGIHGLLSFTVAERDREIGVRLALGADPALVRRMILGEGLHMAIMGVVPGVVIAYLGGRAMSSLLFGVPAADPVTMSVVAVICFSATVSAGLAPAFRAARITPISALRAD